MRRWWTAWRHRGPSREDVSEHGRQLLESSQLSDDERARVSHLLHWLQQPEPAGDFPGRQRGVRDTAMREIGVLWERVHGSKPW